MTPFPRIRRQAPLLAAFCSLACCLPPPAPAQTNLPAWTKAPAPTKSSIQTLVARPEVSRGRRFPLCILLPGGPGRMKEATRVMDSLGQNLASRGWIVVVPVSPDGTSFFAEAADRVVSVMDQMERDPEVRPGRTLLAGVSNGGIAAMQVAGMVPGRVSGVIAVPGTLNHWTKLKGLEHLPVFLRIGAEDRLGWADHYPDMVRRLKNAGARLDARLLDGVGHGVPIDWEELDAWVARELGALGPSPKRTARISLPPSAANLRTWTSRSGQTVEAALAAYREGAVVLMRSDGKRLQIVRENLSREDQVFLDELIHAADGQR